MRQGFCGEMEQLAREYGRTLQMLYERRETLCDLVALDGRRLAVIEEEIDEVEEVLMQMRPYLPVGAWARFRAGAPLDEAV